MIRNVLFASALLLPFSAQADDSRDCRHHGHNRFKHLPYLRHIIFLKAFRKRP